MDNVVLTVSPHPDDEVLGLGATLAMLLAGRGRCTTSPARSGTPRTTSAASPS